MSVFAVEKVNENWCVLMSGDVIESFGPGLWNCIKAIDLCAKLRQGERLDE